MRPMKSIAAVILVITAFFFAASACAGEKSYEVYGTLTTPEGTPAPEVEITIHLGACDRTTVTTDSKGRYKVSFEGISHWFRAEYLDYVLCETVTLPADATEPVRKDLKMEYACLVLGEVTDASTGDPIADAEVQISGSYGSETTTGDDGVFKARIPKRAEMMLGISKDGYVTRRMNFDAKDVPTSAWRIALKPGGVVRGLVVDQNSDPVAGIRVGVMEAGNYVRYTKTDENGRYEIHDVDSGFPARMFVDDIRIPMREYKSVEFPEGSMEVVCDLSVNFEGKELMTIAGTVTDTEGAPVEGARVIFGKGDYWANRKETKTDADGDYTLEGLTREKNLLLVKAEGYAPEFKPVEEGYGQIIDAILKPAHSAELVVVDPSGQPMPEVATWVNVRTSVLGRLYGDFGGGTDVYRSLYSTKTDDKGKVVLENIPAQGAVVSIFKKNFIAPQYVAIRADARDNVIQMQGEPQIGGQVVDAETGAAIRCFTVKWMQERSMSAGGDESTTFNRPDGKFVVQVGDNRYGKTRYTLRVLADGYVGEQRVVDATEYPKADYSNRFELKKTYSVNGKVVDSGGKGIESAKVTVIENRGYIKFTVPPSFAPNAYMQEFTTGPDGSFTIDAIPEKTAVIMVDKPGYLHFIDEKVDISEPFTLSLAIPGAIRIKAENMVGEDAVVELTSIRDQCYYTSLSSKPLPANGDITIPDLKPMDYIVQVRGKVHSEMRRLTLGSGETPSVDLDAERPVTVKGTVSSVGAPAAGQTVYIERGTNQYGSGSHTDADGRYEIAVKEPGPAVLKYYKGEGRERSGAQSMLVDLKKGENIVDIALPQGSISGRVFDAKTGQPLEGEIVEAWARWKPGAPTHYNNASLDGGYGKSYGTTKTAGDGSFTLANLPNGPVVLTVITEHQRTKYIGSPIMVDEKKPVRGVKVPLPDNGTLKVSLVDSGTGDSLWPMQTMLYTADGAPVIHSNRYEEGTSIPAGKYVLWIEPHNGKYLPTYADVEIKPGKTANVTLKLKQVGQRLVFRIPEGSAMLQKQEEEPKRRLWLGYSLADAATGKPVLMGPVGPEWGGYIYSFDSNHEAVLPLKPGKYVLDAVVRDGDDYAVDSKNNLWTLHKEITVVAGKDTVVTVQ